MAEYAALGPQLHTNDWCNQRGPPFDHRLLGNNPCWNATHPCWHCSEPHQAQVYAVLKLAKKSFQPDSLVPLPTPVDVPTHWLRRETFSTRAGALANSNPLSPAWIEDCWVNERAASSNTLRKFSECPSKNSAAFLTMPGFAQTT